MSDSKAKAAKTSTASEVKKRREAVVVKDVAVKHKKHRNIGRIAKLALPVVIVLVGFGIAAIILTGNDAKKTAKVPSPKDPPTREQQAYYDADVQVARGDYAGGQAYLDKTAAETKSAAAKADIYESQALLAYNNEKYQESLDYALKAEKLEPTRQSAIAVGNAYEMLGDKQQAIDYYKKVIQRTTSEQKTLNSDSVTYYESLIEKLSK